MPGGVPELPAEVRGCYLHARWPGMALPTLPVLPRHGVFSWLPVRGRALLSEDTCLVFIPCLLTISSGSLRLHFSLRPLPPFVSCKAVIANKCCWL